MTGGASEPEAQSVVSDVSYEFVFNRVGEGQRSEKGTWTPATSDTQILAKTSSGELIAALASMV